MKITLMAWSGPPTAPFEQATELSQASTDGDINARRNPAPVLPTSSVTVWSAEAADSACVVEREQHIAARRLLTRIDRECVEEKEGGMGRTTAMSSSTTLGPTARMVAESYARPGFLVRTAVNGLDALLDGP